MDECINCHFGLAAHSSAGANGSGLPVSKATVRRGFVTATPLKIRRRARRQIAFLKEPFPRPWAEHIGGGILLSRSGRQCYDCVLGNMSLGPSEAETSAC